MNKTARNWALEAIEGRKDWFVSLCQDLVRIPSPNPPGDTTRVAKYVIALLQERDIPFREYLPRPGNPILVASIGTGLSPKLTLCGHMDVFPVQDPSEWSTDPYGGFLEDGKLYGRGSSDMKAGVAAALGTFLMFVEEKTQMDGTLLLTLVSDEENASTWGARWLLSNVPEVRGDACLIGEPTGYLTPVIGEKSPLWCRLRTSGEQMHGAFSDGRDAIWQMAKAILAIQTLNDLSYSTKGEVAALVAELMSKGKESSGGWRWSLTRPSVNFGTFRGGAKLNLSPGSAELELDLRVPFGATPGELLGELEGVLSAAGVQAEVEVIFGADEAPNFTPWDGDFMQTFRQAVRTSTGQEPQPLLMPYLSDARVYRRHGVQAVLCGPRDYGMGGADEHIEVEEYFHILRIFAQTAVDYCGIRR